MESNFFLEKKIVEGYYSPATFSISNGCGLYNEITLEAAWIQIDLIMSDQILSQEDIDALFAAIRDGEIDLENDPEDAIMEGVEKSKTGPGPDAERGMR